MLELGDSPWRARLTEDLDLALALATAGWRLSSTPQAYVSQQGLTGLRALINQRTRWYQGHMQAGRWLPSLWGSRRLSHLSMLELTLYLLVPWALVLPWSLIFNYNLVLMGMWVAGWVAGRASNADLRERILTVVIWYAVSCIPVRIAGYLYSRQRRRSGQFRALLLAPAAARQLHHLRRLLAGVLPAAGRANSWQKTKRHRERSHRGAPARPARLRPASGPELGQPRRPTAARARRPDLPPAAVRIRRSSIPRSGGRIRARSGHSRPAAGRQQAGRRQVARQQARRSPGCLRVAGSGGTARPRARPLTVACRG